MSKYYATFAIIFLSTVILVPEAHADGTCYAPAPISCATLSTTECAQQESLYQSEADIYNTCIANSYATDNQNNATQAKIRTICAGNNSQSCIASYSACQSGAPKNGFGSPDGASCTYACNDGYYLDVSGFCDPQGVPVAPTPKPVPIVTTTPTPVVVTSPTPAPAQVSPVTVMQTVVAQPATTPAPVTKPKSIFTEITQAVAPKPVTVMPAVTASATTSVTASTSLTSPAVQQITEPVSFWSSVVSLLKKLNPFSWF